MYSFSSFFSSGLLLFLHYHRDQRRLDRVPAQGDGGARGEILHEVIPPVEDVEADEVQREQHPAALVDSSERKEG